MSGGTPGRRMYLAFVIGTVVGSLLFLPFALLMSGSSEAPMANVRLPLRAGGAVVPFTLGRASRVRIEVRLPAMVEADIAIGPLFVAERPHLVLEPDLEKDFVRHVPMGGDVAVFVEDLPAAGAYAVRIPSVPTAMGMEDQMFIEVRVTLVKD